jgi:hypothetical protein
MKKFNVDNLTKSNTFEQPTAGVQEARVLRVIDLGLRKPDPRFQDPKKGPKKPSQQLLFMFELAEDKTEKDGKKVPMIAFYYANVAGRKQSGEHSKFTALIESAGVDKEFTLEDFLGKAVSLTLVKNEKKERVDVAVVAGLSARVASTVPDLVQDSYVLDFDNPTTKVVEKLSDKMKKTLSEALNFPGSKLEHLINTSSTSKEKPSTEEQDTEPSQNHPM